MIVKPEEINTMLAKIGERLDVLEIATFEETQSWMIAIDEETEDSLSLDYDERTGKLFIVANIGAPPDDKRLETFEYLLAYNLAWFETDGVRMALDRDEGEILQIHDVTMHDLSADRLGTVLENFLVLMRTMKGLIAQGVGEDDKPQPPDPGSVMDHVRV